MQKKQQQCHFCEAQASVWVSFVAAGGGVISQPLCEAHAVAMGMLDPLGYSLLEPWGTAGLQPQSLPLPPPLLKPQQEQAGHAQQELFSAAEMGDTSALDAAASDSATGAAGAGAETPAAASAAAGGVDGTHADNSADNDAASGADSGLEPEAAGAESAAEISEMEELLDTAFSAMVEGISAATGGEFKSVSVSLQGMVPLDPAQMQGIAARRTGAACPQCGFTIADWKKLGRLGCPQCYETFGSRIKGQLPHLHGGRAEHFGKIPAGRHFEAACELRMELWQRLLERAVKAEAYEEAAYARDRIAEARRELLLRGHMQGRA